MVLDYNLAANSLAYVFDGPMDAPTINELRKQILDKLEIHDTINIYLEDRGVEYFTLYSVLTGIFFPLQHSKRFNKVVMVTDRKWIHLLSTLNSLFLSSEIRNYTTEERTIGMQWISEGSDTALVFSQLDTPKNAMLEDFSFADNTVGYIIEGKMDKRAILELRSLILEKFEYHDQINLYLEDSSINHFSLSAATIGALFPLEYAGRFNKIALVTDRKWIHVLAAIDNAIIRASLNYFPTEDRLDAITWIANPEL